MPWAPQNDSKTQVSILPATADPRVGYTALGAKRVSKANEFPPNRPESMWGAVDRTPWRRTRDPLSN